MSRNLVIPHFDCLSNFKGTATVQLKGNNNLVRDSTIQIKEQPYSGIWFNKTPNIQFKNETFARKISLIQKTDDVTFDEEIPFFNKRRKS